MSPYNIIGRYLIITYKKIGITHIIQGAFDGVDISNLSEPRDVTDDKTNDIISYIPYTHVLTVNIIEILD
jgi:hypothetical protein